LKGAHVRILLVKPRWFVRGGQYRYLENVRFTPLSLGILAALSEGHEVKIVDGDWQAIPSGDGFNLIGITVTTFTSERVYDLVREFNKRGAKVILGGVHPSILPEECLNHADSVVVGEAEYVWKDVLRDAEKGCLERLYRSERPTHMNDVPFPRRDLLDEPSWFACVQATRGCPNSCRYCYLPSTPWREYRRRAVEHVVEEIRSLRQKLFFFVDDNLFADRDYALRLFNAIIPLKKSWAIQVPATIEDDELLDAMAEAGCFNVQVGFQSFNKTSLKWASVKHNRVEKYRDLVGKLHERKIIVTSFFMFGFDTDGPDVFDATVELAKVIDIDDANLYILTPYPGTPLYARFQREGRLLEGTRRTQFGWSHAVFRPKQMTPEELERGVQRAYDMLYPFFRKKLKRVIFKQFSWLLKHPHMIPRLLGGNIRRARVTTKPA
jgi:radical SAM superfamily enzyme YgiQ (UPF0313 family)